MTPTDGSGSSSIAKGLESRSGSSGQSATSISFHPEPTPAELASGSDRSSVRSIGSASLSGSNGPDAVDTIGLSQLPVHPLRSDSWQIEATRSMESVQSSTSNDWKQMIQSMATEASRLRHQHHQLLRLIAAWQPGDADSVSAEIWSPEPDPAGVDSPLQHTMALRLQNILHDLHAVDLDQLFGDLHGKATAANTALQTTHAAQSASSDHLSQAQRSTTEDEHDGSQFGDAFPALKMYAVSLRQKVQELSDELVYAHNEAQIGKLDQQSTIDLLRGQVLAKDEELRIIKDDIASCLNAASSTDAAARELDADLWREIVGAGPHNMDYNLTRWN